MEDATKQFEQSSRTTIRPLSFAVLAAVLIGLVCCCVLLFPRMMYPSLTSKQLDDLGLRGKERADVRNDRLKHPDGPMRVLSSERESSLRSPAKLTCKRVVDQLGVDRKMLRNWIKQAEIQRAPVL